MSSPNQLKLSIHGFSKLVHSEHCLFPTSTSLCYEEIGGPLVINKLFKIMDL